MLQTQIHFTPHHYLANYLTQLSLEKKKILALSSFPVFSFPLLGLTFSLYTFKTWAFELACDISKASCAHVDFPFKSVCHSHPSHVPEEIQPEMRNKPQTCSSVLKNFTSVLLITHPQSINNWLADTLTAAENHRGLLKDHTITTLIFGHVTVQSCTVENYLYNCI